MSWRQTPSESFETKARSFLFFCFGGGASEQTRRPVGRCASHYVNCIVWPVEADQTKAFLFLSSSLLCMPESLAEGRAARSVALLSSQYLSLALDRGRCGTSTLTQSDEAAFKPVKPSMGLVWVLLWSLSNRFQIQNRLMPPPKSVSGCPSNVRTIVWLFILDSEGVDSLFSPFRSSY